MIKLFLLLVGIVFGISSFNEGIFNTNGVGPGFTPFFVSILMLLSSLYLLFQKLEYKHIDKKNVFLVSIGFILILLSLKIHAFFSIIVVFLFSFVVSTETVKNKIKYSLFLSVLCSIVLVILKYVGIEIV